MAWSVRNLATVFDAPRALLGPAAYLFAAQSTRHAIYLGADDRGNSTGILYEGYCGADDVWHFKNLMNEAHGAPPAIAAPTAYAFEAEQTQHVLYRAGDNHIHELYWDGSWNHNDLTNNTGAPEISGQAFGWEFVTGGRQEVVYRGVDNFVHLLTRGYTGNPQWQHQALTKAGDPLCAVSPGGYPFETGRSQHVNYRSNDSGDQRLYEIVQDPNTGKWGAPIDMANGLTGVPQVIDDQHRGFADEASGIRYVDFLGDDYNIYEYSFSGSWNLTNLTKSCVPPAPLAYAGYRPAPYMFPSTPAVPTATQHSIYIGADQVQELWRYPGQTWNENALSGVMSGMLLNSPSAFVDKAASTQNIFLATSAGEIIELRWKVGDRIIFHPPPRQKHE